MHVGVCIISCCLCLHVVGPVYSYLCTYVVWVFLLCTRFSVFPRYMWISNLCFRLWMFVCVFIWVDDFVHVWMCLFWIYTYLWTHFLVSFCMYCICIFMCLWMFEYVGVWMCSCKSVVGRLRRYICMFVNILPIYSHFHMCIRFYAWVLVYMCVFKWIHLYVFLHLSTFMYSCIYV